MSWTSRVEAITEGLGLLRSPGQSGTNLLWQKISRKIEYREGNWWRLTKPTTKGNRHRADLYAEAWRRGIPGHSKMTKRELQHALD